MPALPTTTATPRKSMLSALYPFTGNPSVTGGKISRSPLPSPASIDKSLVFVNIAPKSVSEASLPTTTTPQHPAQAVGRLSLRLSKPQTLNLLTPHTPGRPIVQPPTPMTASDLPLVVADSVIPPAPSSASALVMDFSDTFRFGRSFNAPQSGFLSPTGYSDHDVSFHAEESSSDEIPQKGEWPPLGLRSRFSSMTSMASNGRTVSPSYQLHHPHHRKPSGGRQTRLFSVSNAFFPPRRAFSQAVATRKASGDHQLQLGWGSRFSWAPAPMWRQTSLAAARDLQMALNI